MQTESREISWLVVNATMDGFVRKMRLKKMEILKTFALAWPLAFSYTMLFFIPLISLQFSGHKDKDLLAAIGLAISFGNAFGFTVVMGVDFTCQTLCSQAYGAGNFRKLGILLQRSIVILILLSLPLFGIWTNAEKILLGFHQNANISRITGQFLTWYMPTIWLFGIFRLLNTFLACQNIVRPQIYGGIVACATSIISNLILSYVLDVGIAGYALSTELAYIAGCLVVVGSIVCCGLLENWPGWSLECLEEWGQFAPLLIPSSVLMLLDWGGSETGVILIGLLGKADLAAMSAAYNILCVIYVVCQGITVAAGVRVGSLMGASKVEQAKDVAKGAVVLTVGVTSTIAIILLSAKDYLGNIFTGSKVVIELVSGIVPLLAAYHILDCSVSVMYGILNGLGLQKYAAAISLIGYDLIGLLLGIVFAFVLKMRLEGFWLGQVIGVTCMVIMGISVIVKANWTACSEMAVSRAQGKLHEVNGENGKKETIETGSVNGEVIPLLPSKKGTFSSLKEVVIIYPVFHVIGRVAFVVISFSLFIVGVLIKIFV